MCKHKRVSDKMLRDKEVKGVLPVVNKIESRAEQGEAF